MSERFGGGGLMEGVLTAPGRTRTLNARLSIDPGSLSAWLLPAGVVTYLGMRSGGYDAVVSGQVAVAIWWVVFLIFALALAPLRLSRAAWVGLALLVAYSAWTALSLTWTESAERTMGDVSLVLLYIPLALLAFSIRGRDAGRLMLDGLAVAVVAIAVVALLSRLRFEWFAIPQTTQNLPGSSRKLSYPIGYWNALAALVAMGIPLLARAATGARRLVWRALAAGAIPPLVLCTYLTVSRGGAIAVVIGVVVFLILAPDRLPKLVLTAVCGGAGAMLIRAADQRPQVRDGMRTLLASHQGDQLIAITLVIAAAVALIAYAIALVDRHARRPRFTVLSRSRASWLSASCAVVAVAAFVAAGGPGFLHREWDEFKTPNGPSIVSTGTALQRLQNVTGNGRYQYWQSAVRAAKAHPLTGTGAGTFVYWWARDGTVAGGYVQDAHSLYFQTLGELGYPGLVVICCLIGWILLYGVIRCIRTRDAELRLGLAAATAGAFVFAFSAAVEWIWLIPVLPAMLFMLAAVIFGPAGRARSRAGRVRARAAAAAGTDTLTGAPSTTGAAGRPRGAAGRPRGAARRTLTALTWRGAASAVGAVTALGAIVVVALPMAATAAVRQSQAASRAGNIPAALASAREAVRLQPYAGSSWEQEALVLEVAGDLRPALAGAARAEANDPYDASTWIILSRLEAQTGNARAALADYVRARTLDPHSSIFASP